jgi:adenylate cyclase, class 2
VASIIQFVAVEIEKKYRIDSERLQQIATRLEELGAIYIGETFEENFLHRGGVLDGRDAVLRLRKANGKAILTYKEKVGSQADFKHQIEHETAVSDEQAAEHIIQRLGFTLAIVYEKHRKTWKYHDVEVVLDELPFGYYMEIEGPPEGITRAETSLGIKDLEVEPRGYPRLTLKFGTAIDGVIESRFQTEDMS